MTTHKDLPFTHPPNTSPKASPRPRITLRPATPQDAPSIATLGAHTWTATFGHSVSAADLQLYLDGAYSLDATRRDILDPNKDMIVATTTVVPPSGLIDEGSGSGAGAADDGSEEILGFALLARGTTDPCLSRYAPDTLIELQRIYIHPSHQSLGLGPLLAQELEARARRTGYKYIWLGVWEENVKAQRVYSRMGYVRVGEHGFTIGGEVQMDWIMVKEL